MVNWKHFQEAFIPNLVVVLMTVFISYTSLIYVFPQLITKYSSESILIYFIYFLAIINLLMFLWCWFYTVIADPGRVADDLEKRGFLDQIKRGDIPYCLQHLPLCKKCQIPIPPNSYHCIICNACHARFDHHCGVVGQCIADKNTKSFILSFIYASIFGVFASASCFFYCFKFKNKTLFTLSNYEKLVFVIALYAAFITVFVFCFAISMMTSVAVFLVKIHKSLSLAHMLKLFGNKWYQFFIPIQNNTTNYAWSGICWIDDLDCLL